MRLVSARKAYPLESGLYAVVDGCWVADLAVVWGGVEGEDMVVLSKYYSN